MYFFVKLIGVLDCLLVCLRRLSHAYVRICTAFRMHTSHSFHLLFDARLTGGGVGFASSFCAPCSSLRTRLRPFASHLRPRPTQRPTQCGRCFNHQCQQRPQPPRRRNCNGGVSSNGLYRRVNLRMELGPIAETVQLFDLALLVLIFFVVVVEKLSQW